MNHFFFVFWSIHISNDQQRYSAVVIVYEISERNNIANIVNVLLSFTFSTDMSVERTLNIFHNVSHRQRYIYLYGFAEERYVATLWFTKMS